MVLGADKISKFLGNEAFVKPLKTGFAQPLQEVRKPVNNLETRLNKLDNREISPVTTGVSGDKFDSNRWFAEFGK